MESEKAVPRLCTNRPGRVRDISDQVLKDGLNIVGDESSSKALIHGMILEDHLEKGLPIAIVADSNIYAGLSEPNPASSSSRGYEVATLGAGNPGANIEPTDGALIAQVALKSGIAFVANLDGMDEGEIADFYVDYADEMANMERADLELMMGFADLDQHLARRRLGRDSKAVRKTHFMAGRMSRKNVKMVNALRGIRETPIEFDRDLKNTIAMLQVDSQGRVNLATRVGGEYGRQMLDNEMVEDCGLALTHVDYGTCFNPSDRETKGPFIVRARVLRSSMGDEPNRTRTLNAATQKFIKELEAARSEREKQVKKELTQSIIDAEKKRLFTQSIKNRVRAKANCVKNSVSGNVSAVSQGAGKVRINNQLTCGTAAIPVVKNLGRSNAGATGSAALAVCAYRQTGGQTTQGQDIAMEDFLAAVNEIPESLPRGAEKVRFRNGLPTKELCVSAFLISGGNETIANEFYEFVSSDSINAQRMMRKIARIKSERGRDDVASAITAAMVQAWQAEQSGSMIARFTAEIPEDVANDDKPIANVA